MPDFDFGKIRELIVGVNQELVPESTVVNLLLSLMEILIQENNLVRVPAPLRICGDIHGQLDDLLQLFQVAGNIQSNSDPKFELRDVNYLFLGDYVDRGYHGLNTLLYLVTLKLEFRNRVFLLRGNHESRQVSSHYGLYNEIMLNYGNTGLFNLVNEVFDLLPISAVANDNIFCCHGGLSPDIPMLERISLIDRQQELPQSGELADLTWSDPENVRDWVPNRRGAGFLFGFDQTAKFVTANRLAYVVRSHQLCQQGFQKYFGDPENNNDSKPRHGFRLLTIWSAPNYCYTSNNIAAFLNVGVDGKDRDIITFISNKIRIVPPENEMPAGQRYFA
jgi:diadenosine tetraphosphatase ApaH/serine/threonine PP2A family protein phosphatase